MSVCDKNTDMVNVHVNSIEHVLDLLQEALYPKVTFDFDYKLEDVKAQADKIREQMIVSAMHGLYNNIPGLKVRLLPELPLDALHPDEKDLLK